MGEAFNLLFSNMNRVIGAVLLAGILATTSPSGADPPRQNIEVYFSPNGGCTKAVVTVLSHATNSILVQAYSFTSAPIAKALVEAHKRGVKIQVILDKSQRTQHYSSADFVAHAGIPIYIDAEHPIAHNRIIIIDGNVVVDRVV